MVDDSVDPGNGVERYVHLAEVEAVEEATDGGSQELRTTVRDSRGKICQAGRRSSREGLGHERAARLWRAAVDWLGSIEGETSRSLSWTSCCESGWREKERVCTQGCMV